MTARYLREAQLTYSRTSVKLESPDVRSSETVYRIAGPLIGSRIVESLIVIALDVRRRVIGIHEVSRGTVDGCLVQTSDVFRYPLIAGACAVILAHNHPSGSVEPSPDDLRLTERVRDAGKLLGIPVLDHVIVSDSAYFSFLDQGLISHEQGRTI